MKNSVALFIASIVSCDVLFALVVCLTIGFQS